MSSSNSTKAALLDLRRRNRQPSPNFSLWATAKLPAGPLSRLRREPRFFPSALTAHSLKDRPAIRYLAVSQIGGPQAEIQVPKPISDGTLIVKNKKERAAKNILVYT